MSSATGGRIAAASVNVTVVTALKDIGLEIGEADRVGIMGHVSSLISLGLGDFLEMPVRTCSSGVLMRLLFSIVTSVLVEILSRYEWMSEGDADFVIQAKKRLGDSVSSAGMVVLASHGGEVINHSCNFVVHPQRGEIASLEWRRA